MNFLKEHSYILTRLLVTQLGMMIFGSVLSTAFLSIDGALIYISLFSVLFYLFLVYVAIWPLGASDVIRVDAGRQKRMIGKGFLLGTIAAAPMLLISLLGLFGYIFGHSALTTSGGVGLYGVTRILLYFWQSPYIGISNAVLPPIGDTGAYLFFGASVAPSVYYFLLWLFQVLFTLPGIAITGVGYIFGHKNIAILSPEPKPKNK